MKTEGLGTQLRCNGGATPIEDDRIKTAAPSNRGRLKKPRKKWVGDAHNISGSEHQGSKAERKAERGAAAQHREARLRAKLLRGQFAFACPEQQAAYERAFPRQQPEHRATDAQRMEAKTARNRERRKKRPAKKKPAAA